MQRILFALVALISLLTINIRPTQAQDRTGQAVEPSATPQPVDERVGGPATAPRLPMGGQDDGGEPVTVEAGQTKEALAVRDTPLVIAGHVKDDVLAVNSDVTIKPGAKVGGNVVAIGGSVDNEAGDAVHVIKLTPKVLPALESAPGMLTAPAPPVTPAPAVQPQAPAPVPRHKEDWFGGQVALLLLGIVGGLVALIVAPRATHQVASRISLEPARCLVVGGIGAVATVVVLSVNAGLLHSPVRYLWAPFGVVIALLPALALAFGWLTGMRFAGDIVARRFAHLNNPGRLYTRMALGLAAFFLAKVILGSLSIGLGMVVLLLEAVVALMGVGAILITGFGSDPDWLSDRLRGQARWFSWGRRP
jgi:hypothetical protein